MGAGTCGNGRSRRRVGQFGLPLPDRPGWLASPHHQGGPRAQVVAGPGHLILVTLSVAAAEGTGPPCRTLQVSVSHRPWPAISRSPRLTVSPPTPSRALTRRRRHLDTVRRLLLPTRPPARRGQAG